MKKLIPIGLLAMSAAILPAAMAQAASEPEAATVDAEEAKTRKELEAARERLDKAAREVAELSAKLGAHARHEVRFIEGGPRRAVLGVQIEADPGSKGVRVLSVSPGGPAAEAGLKDRDIIVALDGEPLSGPDPDRQLVTKMRRVKPDQKVKVVVLRDGKKRDYVVVARPMAIENRVFSMRMPEMGAFGAVAGEPMVRQFRNFWPGEFEGLELATITPKLGAYFGVNEGVLVVQAPKDGAFKLEDGDVLQAIDGRKPDNGPHALRILRSYGTGEKLTLAVLRQRKPVTLAVTMPERPEMGDVFHWATPAMPLPATPHAPPAPPEGAVYTPGKRVSPEGAGTLE